MKTKELIAELQRLDPTGELMVEVPVKSYTAAHPHDYLEPFSVSLFSGYSVRIYVSAGSLSRSEAVRAIRALAHVCRPRSTGIGAAFLFSRLPNRPPPARGIRGR